MESAEADNANVFETPFRKPQDAATLSNVTLTRCLHTAMDLAHLSGCGLF